MAYPASVSLGCDLSLTRRCGRQILLAPELTFFWLPTWIFPPVTIVYFSKPVCGTLSHFLVEWWLIEIFVVWTMLMNWMQAASRRPVNLPRWEERLTHLVEVWLKRGEWRTKSRAVKAWSQKRISYQVFHDHILTKDRNVKRWRNWKTMHLGGKTKYSVVVV